MNRLYKYYPFNEYLLNTIKKCEIWFSSPESFNDPFDCNVEYTYIKDTRYDKKINEILAQEHNRTIKHEPYYLKESILKNVAKSYDNSNKTSTMFSNLMFKFQTKHVGISCFSKKHNNILMWSHYADNHRGVCLKFNISDEVFFDEFHPVTYINRFPSFQDRSDFSDSNKFLFYIKAKDWEYESEVRVLKKPNELFGFNPRVLEAIYFGAKCTSDNISKMIDIIRNLNTYNNLKFYQMRLDSEGFGLIEEEINN